MHWILQDIFFEESTRKGLVDALDRLGLPYSVHKVVPFVGELIPPYEGTTKNVIPIGSYSLRHAAKRCGWKPGVFDLEDVDFMTQRDHWGQEMLNYDSVVCAFRDVAFPLDRMFARPVLDSKSFAGRVFSREEFSKWQDDVSANDVDEGRGLFGDTLVQLCAPKDIHAEYRYWVVDGRIATRSMYKQGSRVYSSPHVDERFDVYVQERIAKWQPHDAFVIDVCDTPDGIKIVEINTLNAAGFYAADLMKLVMALEERFGRSG